jgi:RNA polymerase sigma-70 factor (ECF subfamily)
VAPNPASDPSDDDCVRRAQAGDRTAYSILVRRHQASLHRHLARMVGSSDEALELAQETFVRAWQALPRWEPGAQFRTWLFRIASNAALDVVRRRKTVEFIPLDDAFEAADTAAGPERLAQAAQEVRRLEAALARLAPEHREVLLLREVEDMSYEEIGRVLAIAEGTVKSRIARARAALIAETGKDTA